VLVNHCTVDSDHKLILNNRENREEYRVLFLPAGDTISAAAAAKIKQFYDQGGQVIATGMLPTRSAEFGKDAEVKQTMAPDEPLKAYVGRAQDRQNFYVFWYYINKNAARGQALYLPVVHPWLIDYALKLVRRLRDVDIQEPMAPLRRGNEYQGALTISTR
jgi:hypothetical protein